MRQREIWMFIVLLTAELIPCKVLAQTSDPPPPPPCCNNQDPPPPGGISVVVGGGADELMPQITISDTALGLLGQTRTQFLDNLAAALFTNPDQKLYLVIPVETQVTLPDGSVINQVVYYQLEKSMVTPQVIDLLDVLYLTDGQTTIKVTFNHDVTAPNG